MPRVGTNKSRSRRSGKPVSAAPGRIRYHLISVGRAWPSTAVQILPNLCISVLESGLTAAGLHKDLRISNIPVLWTVKQALRMTLGLVALSMSSAGAIHHRLNNRGQCFRKSLTHPPAMALRKLAFLLPAICHGQVAAAVWAAVPDSSQYPDLKNVPDAGPLVYYLCVPANFNSSVSES